MKKVFLSVILAATLAACGGGGDSDPVPAVDYSKYNGNYICKHVAYPEVNLAVTADFTEKAALLIMANNSSVTYSDSLGEVSGNPRWSKQLTNLVDYESVTFTNDGTMLLYVGPGTDFTTYYTNRIAFCRKV
jgi:ABC-type uncharacterized transport system auxiliary subunit